MKTCARVKRTLARTVGCALRSVGTFVAAGAGCAMRELPRALCHSDANQPPTRASQHAKASIIVPRARKRRAGRESNRFIVASF